MRRSQRVSATSPTSKTTKKRMRFACAFSFQACLGTHFKSPMATFQEFHRNSFHCVSRRTRSILFRLTSRAFIFVSLRCPYFYKIPYLKVLCFFLRGKKAFPQQRKSACFRMRFFISSVPWHAFQVADGDISRIPQEFISLRVPEDTLNRLSPRQTRQAQGPCCNRGCGSRATRRGRVRSCCRGSPPPT